MPEHTEDGLGMPCAFQPLSKKLRQLAHVQPSFSGEGFNTEAVRERANRQGTIRNLQEP